MLNIAYADSVHFFLLFFFWSLTSFEEFQIFSAFSLDSYLTYSLTLSFTAFFFIFIFLVHPINANYVLFVSLQLMCTAFFLVRFKALCSIPCRSAYTYQELFYTTDVCVILSANESV